MNKFTKALFIILFILANKPTALSQNTKRKLDCRDSVIVLNALYQKSILISNGLEAKTQTQDTVIKLQTTVIKNQCDSIAVSEKKISEQGDKIKRKNKHIGTLLITSVLQCLFIVAVLL